MALTRYEGPAEVYVNGQLLAQARTARLRLISNNNRVYTMIGGMVGRSRGPRETEASVESAVPISGLEVDFRELLVNDADITMILVDGGKRIQADGWIDDVESTRDAQQPAAINFNFAGGPARIL